MKLEGTQVFTVGEVKPLRVKVWNLDDPATDISSATVTCILYKRDGTTELTSGAMTTSGTTLLDCVRNWTPGSATPGKFRAVATVVYASKTFLFQWDVELLPAPAAM